MEMKRKALEQYRSALEESTKSLALAKLEILKARVYDNGTLMDDAELIKAGEVVDAILTAIGPQTAKLRTPMVA